MLLSRINPRVHFSTFIKPQSHPFQYSSQEIILSIRWNMGVSKKYASQV